jgi:hypothetical protein
LWAVIIAPCYQRIYLTLIKSAATINGAAFFLAKVKLHFLEVTTIGVKRLGEKKPR